MPCSNLAGFGGESLFVTIASAKGKNLYEDQKAMMLTIAFWSVSTIVLLLSTRFLVLSLLEKILQSLSSNKEKWSVGKKKEETSTHPNAYSFFGDGEGEDENNEVSSNLDYLDDRFLLATLIGSCFIGIITNVYMKLYLSGVGELLGMAVVVAIDYCLIRKSKKRYYEEPKGM